MKQYICPICSKKIFGNRKSFTNHTRWCEGKMEKARIKIGKIHKGQHYTEESKGKISKANKKTFREGRVIWNKGVPRTEETKRKMSKKLKGRKCPMKGKHHTEEAKKKMSEAKKGKYMGQGSSNWRGGISFEPYSLEFNEALKKQIRKRDDYTCQECHQTEKELGYPLACHHIDYDKKNNGLNNLISLCRSCHSQTNFGRNDWTKYFINKQNV